MSILYLGKFFPKRLVENLVYDSKGKMGMSNHNFEMSIIDGLCQQNHLEIKCISVPSVYSYPYNNRRLYTPKESYYYKNVYVSSIGFCNLPIVKEVWSTIVLLFQLIKHFYTFKDSRINVVVNTPNDLILGALQVAKLFTRKEVTQTVIIPDIPSLVTLMGKQKFFKNLVLKYRNRIAMKYASQSNGLVLLTKQMIDFIKKPIPYIVMEGIIDIESKDIINNNANIHDSNKEIILYTGTLREIFGVMNLVKAFKKIENSDIELWICGSGDANNAIHEASLLDSRIKFFGLVDSLTALKLQQEATILVNPRTSDGEYTKYSFPSKTIEYLLSAKSVIINKLPGIPDEYFKYVFTPKNESIDALAECIEKVINTNRQERLLKAIEGRNFIIVNKNSKIQTNRILEMINSY